MLQESLELVWKAPNDEDLLHVSFSLNETTIQDVINCLLCRYNVMKIRKLLQSCLGNNMSSSFILRLPCSSTRNRTFSIAHSPTATTFNSIYYKFTEWKNICAEHFMLKWQAVISCEYDSLALTPGFLNQIIKNLRRTISRFFLSSPIPSF